MSDPVARIRRFYGANPLHLLALLGSFTLAGYVVLRLNASPSLLWMGVWFAGSLILHDFVLFPLYALADRSLAGALRRRNAAPPAVSALNYIRVPALGAGLTFAVFFPGIIEQGSAWFRTATGLTQEPYLERWLLLTAAMFLASAVVYALRQARTK